MNTLEMQGGLAGNEGGEERFSAALDEFKGGESNLKRVFENSARALALVGALSGLSACASGHVEMRFEVNSSSGVPLNYPGPVNRSGNSYRGGGGEFIGGPNQGFTFRGSGSPLHPTFESSKHSENIEEGKPSVVLAQEGGMTLGAQVEIDGVTHTFEIPYSGSVA